MADKFERHAGLPCGSFHGPMFRVRSGYVEIPVHVVETGCNFRACGTNGTTPPELRSRGRFALPQPHTERDFPGPVRLLPVLGRRRTDRATERTTQQWGAVGGVALSVPRPRLRLLQVVPVDCLTFHQRPLRTNRPSAVSGGVVRGWIWRRAPRTRIPWADAHQGT